MVKQARNSAKKAVKAGRSAVLKSIKSEIEETGENDLAFKVADDTIKTSDTAVSVKIGINTAI